MPQILHINPSMDFSQYSEVTSSTVFLTVGDDENETAMSITTTEVKTAQCYGNNNDDDDNDDDLEDTDEDDNNENDDD